MTAQPTLIHAVIIVVLVAAYTALTIAGHDGNALIGALGGYLGGATVVAATAAPKP